MQLTVKDAAKLLQVSERTIYRWLGEGSIPSFRVQDQHRFNRVELLEWATRQRLPVSPEIFSEPDDSGRMPSLGEALEAGGIHYRIAGRDKEAVIRAIVRVLPLPEGVDREFLYSVFMAREALGSTGVGDGIAVPHVRNPVVLHVSQPQVSLCFLEQPIEFGAVDGKPVHALFAIVSPTVRAHLKLLSRLAFLLKHDRLRHALATQASREEILETIAQLERPLRPRAGPE